MNFLSRKWAKEQNYRLIKGLWSTHQNRIAVRFAYEWQSQEGQWWRSYGNEMWAFDETSLISSRHASINDVPIIFEDRKFLWEGTQRPEDYPSLSELGL